MATTAVSRALMRKTGTFWWGLRSKAVSWLPLLICFSITLAYSCFSLFIYRFGVSSFYFFVRYNLLLFNKKPDIWQVTVCTFYLLFHSKVTSNSILLYKFLFYFRVTSNSIPLCSQELKACYIFPLAVADNIFVIGAINKVIKLIAEYIK